MRWMRPDRNSEAAKRHGSIFESEFSPRNVDAKLMTTQQRNRQPIYDFTCIVYEYWETALLASCLFW